MDSLIQKNKIIRSDNVTAVRLTECSDYKVTYGYLVCFDDVEQKKFADAVLEAKYKVCDIDCWCIDDMMDVLSKTYNVQFIDDCVVAI